MDSRLAKDIMKLMAVNKDEIYAILEMLDPRNIGSGEIHITEELINKGLWEFVKEKAGDRLDDYTVHFDGGRIYLEVITKIMVKVKINMVITVKSLEFDGNGHRLTFTYEKGANSPGNTLIPKALEKVAEKNPTLMMVKGNLVVINIDGFMISKDLPYWLTLNYLNAIAGKLKLGYRIIG